MEKGCCDSFEFCLRVWRFQTIAVAMPGQSGEEPAKLAQQVPIDKQPFCQAEGGAELDTWKLHLF